jgi:hypothetical protein
MKMLFRAGLLLPALAASAAAHAQVYDLKQHPMAIPGTAVSGSLSAAGASSPVQVRGDFNLSLWGTFSATCGLERSFDSGASWLPLTALGTALSWSGPASETLNEPEYGVQYHLKCSAVTSGTLNYRVSQ